MAAGSCSWLITLSTHRKHRDESKKEQGLKHSKPSYSHVLTVCSTKISATKCSIIFLNSTSSEEPSIEISETIRDLSDTCHHSPYGLNHICINIWPIISMTKEQITAYAHMKNSLLVTDRLNAQWLSHTTFIELLLFRNILARFYRPSPKSLV